MQSNSQHLQALETQLLFDAKDHYYRTGETMHAAEHYSHAIALCIFAQYEVTHSDILHVITNVDWAIEEYEQRDIDADIDWDITQSIAESDIPF